MHRRQILPGPTGKELALIIEEGLSVGKTMMQIAREIPMSYTVMHSRYETFRKGIHKDVYPFNYEFGKPWELSGDWMVVGDVHIPMTDTDFAMLPAVVAAKHMNKPRRLLIAGDFFNMDSFSSFAEIVQLPTWAQERQGAEIMVKAWLETFDQIYMLMGNHERRMQKFTIGALNEDDILALIKAPKNKVKMSGFAYCTIKTKTGTWRVTHQQNYRQAARSTVNSLAQKYRQHIVGFHEHHSSISVDDSGNNILVNVGGLADGNKFPYVGLQDNTKPTMKKSFLMLKNGYPYLFTDMFTDWSAWL